MRIPPAALRGIRDGTVDLAFRRWTTPRVLRGTRLRTSIGLVEVTSVSEIAVGAIDEEAARRAGSPSRDALLRFLDRHPDRPLFRVGLRYAGPDPRVALRADAELSAGDVAALDARLERLDRASRHGAWTAAALEIIARQPATRAPDLAAELGLETPVFKRDVRKLKELGLTESLEVGYRISPRGRAFMAARGDGG